MSKEQLKEVGELAKVIRKEETTMLIDNNRISNYDTIESEAADIFIVLCTLCNNMKIFKVSNKEHSKDYNLAGVTISHIILGIITILLGIVN